MVSDPVAGGRGLRLSEHTHAGHVYDTREEQLGVTVTFFRASLGDGLRCVYVHGQSDDSAALQLLARAGLDVSACAQFIGSERRRRCYA